MDGLVVPLTVSDQSVGTTCELVPLNDNGNVTSSPCSDTRPDTDNVPDDRHRSRAGRKPCQKKHIMSSLVTIHTLILGALFI